MSFRLFAVMFVAALMTTACSAPEPPEKPDPAQKRDSAKIVEVSPITGLELPEGRPNRPIAIVKIDNTHAAKPQYGVDQADMVVEELVEGGLTRLAAFFYSTTPAKVGPVRSLRATDIGIAAPVNGQLIASGGAAVTNKRIKAAGLTYHTEGGGAPGFSSGPHRSRPYNRILNLRTLLKGVKTTQIPGPYFHWAPAHSTTTGDPGAATKTTKATRAAVTFSTVSTTRWALKGGKWSRANGLAAPGDEFRADTMVVLFCDVGDAGYLDPAGNPVPETIFKGTGRAVVFRGDTVTEATWAKNDLGATITVTGPAGNPIGFPPGKTWIELVPKGDGAVNFK